MRIAISSDGRTIKSSKIVPTPKEFENGIEALKQVVVELSSGEKITAVAGSVAGPLDKTKSMLVASPHIPGWIQKPFKTQLESVFECRVLLENDTALGGLGEAVFGAGAGNKIVAFINIGTGVNGAKIEDGKIDENALGFETGHQIIVPSGKPCNCGGKGHLESYIGGENIERIYGQKAEDLKDPAAWDEIAKYAAIGINNTIVHWSPDILVLGGSVSQSLPLDRVKAHLTEELKIFPQIPEVVLGTLGHDAGFCGALKLLSLVD